MSQEHVLQEDMFYRSTCLKGEHVLQVTCLREGIFYGRMS